MNKLEIAVAALERISAGDVMTDQPEYTHGDTVVAYQRICREALAAIQAQPDVAVGGDAKDAARYRYVRDTGTLETAVWEALEGYGCADNGELDQSAYAAGMDRAIDAAIQAQGSDAA